MKSNNSWMRRGGGKASAMTAIFFATVCLSACSTTEEDPDNGTNTGDDADIQAADLGAIDTNGVDAPAGVDTNKPVDTGEPPECTVAAVDVDCKDKVTADPDKCEAVRCENSKCVVGQAPVDAPCKSGSECYTDTKCTAAGKCEGPLACTPKASEGNPLCIEAFCNDQSKCQFKNKDVTCDDDNECTKDDACKFKQCNGVQINIDVECDDNKACTEDTCDATAGCVHKVEPMNGKPCNSGDSCTTNNLCDKGECSKGTPVVCDDNNDCTKDSCDATEGCQFKDLATGAKCDDGSKCTDPDACDSGKCVGPLIAAAQPTSACEQLTCDPKTGKVTAKAAQDGLQCDDAKPCTIGDQCLGGSCKGKELVCNQGDPCKNDYCDEKNGNCAQEPKDDGVECNDGNECTTKNSCKGGSCVGSDWQDSGQCDDKNTCTSDGCSPKTGCFHVPANDKFCQDGDACTELDKCFGGKCIGQTKTCDDNNPCTKDACDPKNGNCGNTTFVGPCDDGKKCTTNTICTEGKCQGDPVQCDDDNPCTTDHCDTLVGCKYVAKAGGSPCSDGVSCTLNDKCDGGKCKGDDQCLNCTTDTQCLGLNDGNPCTGQWKCTEITTGKKVCELDQATIIKCPGTEDECSAYLCNPKTAKCDLNKKSEGVKCQSGDKCIVAQSKTCSADGKCVGDKVDCNDKEDCTGDICDKTKGCVHVPKADKTPCDDGSVCTPSTECLGGKCTGANNCDCTQDAQCAKYEDGDLCNGIWKCLPGAGGKTFCTEAANPNVPCKALDGEPCKVNLCDKGSGACGAQPVENGGKCDDGDECSIKEACKDGKCTAGGKIDCNDDNACTFDVCDKVFGCGNAAINEGGICDDGSVCTEKDKCIKGKCAGIKTDCNDGNACTIDLCDQQKGGCAIVLNDGGECNDGNPCTDEDVCKDGKCAGAALKCDDGNPCTIDACDGAGGCKNVLVAGKDCSDDDPCTISDLCGQDGKCQGKPKNCGDGNDCTVDQCIKGACVITAQIGQACTDNNKCTENDKCDPQGACVSQPVNCDDGNPCTAVIGDCSPKNGCTVVQSDGKFCEDGDKCTINSKCQGGGCQGTKLNCDDENPCTDDTCVKDKGCVNKQNVCDDGNDCTSSSCDKVKGCIFAAIDGFQPCEDGDSCTKGGVCNKDKCESKLVKCDDDNECTTDSCDPKTVLDEKVKDGCVFLPIEATETLCDDGDPCTTSHCLKGACHPHSIKCDDGNPCTIDSCDKLKGCITKDVKEQTECDDGDSCTDKTVCQGGFCSGGNMTCPLCPNGTDEECAIFDDNDLCNGKYSCVLNQPGNKKLGGKCVEDKTKVVCDSINDLPCLKNKCNPLNGKCAKTELINGAPCEDGVPCTIKDVCNNGSCVSGVLADCSAVGDACNSAVCIADLGSKEGYSCVGLAKTGTVTCDADNDGCTAHDQCDNGKCKAGKAIDCEGIQGECEVVACVSKGGDDFTCKVSLAPNYSPCDDGQLCTAGDFCDSGKCKAGLKPYTCIEKSNECADFVCDPKGNGASGACMPKPKNEKGSCNADDNGCTVKDICVQGSCVPGAPPDCSAKNSTCTIGACKPGAGGAFSCVGSPRNEDKPCDADGDGCTVDDHCSVGECKPGKLLDCSKLGGNGGCLVGACTKISSSQGSCKAVPAKVGTDCNADDNGCTKDDKCNADGACQNGAPVNCLAFAGTCATGQCVPDGKDPNKFTCTGDPKPDGTDCDADGDGCTVKDKCAKGKCEPGKAPDCSKEAKGACILGGCKNKGSDQYLCLPVPKDDGDVCDADGDGCTVKDGCIGGTCAVGPLETCKEFAGFCGDAVCKSETTTKFSCLTKAKESYPNLDPEVSCKPKADPKCPANYKCVTINEALDEGVCNAKVQVACADGDACSENDVCSAGKCLAGTPKDCDDKDNCTLDSCAAGKCVNQAIAGCSNCIDQGWEIQLDPAGGQKVPNLPANEWVVLSLEPEADPLAKAPKTTYRYGDWLFQNVKTYNNSLWAIQALWEKDFEAASPEATPQVISRLLHRRVYAKKGPLTLSFQLHMEVYNQQCTSDAVGVWVNNQKVWERCDDTKPIDLVDGFIAVSVDLTKWSGAPIDLEFRAIADASKAGFGKVTVDDVKLTGACGPGCLGTSFENPQAAGAETGQTASPRIPGVWKKSASAASYLDWKVDEKVGHTGVSSIKALWAKAPPGGIEQTATLTIPGVMPVAGDIFNFALRIKEVGSTDCGADDFTVLIDGKAAYVRCTTQADWKVQSIDLSPWATKTIDIVLQAKSGKLSSSKGSIEIDDVAISGKCKYMCMSEEFEPTGIKNWNASSADVANLKWTLSTTKYQTKPNAAYVKHDKLAKNDKAAHLIGKVAAGMQTMIPVAGAEYSFFANVAMSADLCSADPAKPGQAILGVLLQIAEEPIVATIDEPDPHDPTWTLGSFCDSSGGWKETKGVVDPAAGGNLVVPTFEIGKFKANDSAEVYIDSLKLVCK